MLLPKYSAWTKDFNRVLSLIKSNGLMYHFFHDPLPLEITMDYLVFTFVDDSEEKLSIETFMVIFVFLLVGQISGIIALLVERWIFKRQEEKKRIHKRKPKVAT
jgi:hypothetical protein